MDICRQAAESEEYVILHLEHPLEVGGDGLHLLPESTIAGHANAVLAFHRHDRTAIVLEDARHCFHD